METSNRLLKDLEDNEARKNTLVTFRNTPLPVKEIGHSQPMTLLLDLILAWPPWDLRYKKYGSLEDELLVDLVKGVELKVTRKDLQNNLLEITLEAQTNLDEYERYNLVVREHNDEWRKRGSPKDVFDPVHGDVKPILDNFVDPAYIDSKHDPIPDTAYRKTSCGPLQNSRPSMSRQALIKILYHLDISDQTYTLGYVVRDSHGRVVYYNQVSHQDLAYLVRRSVQEIWGNPTTHDISRNLLEGIPQLIQGKKLSICQRDNDRPTILDDTSVIKTKNVELVEAEIAEASTETLEKIARYYVPIILIVVMIVYSFRCLNRAVNGQNIRGEYLFWMLVIVGVLVISRKVAQGAARQASAIEHRKKFL